MMVVTSDSPSRPDYIGFNPMMAFRIAARKLQAVEKSATDITKIKEKLKISGFSQNGRNRLIHLSGEELNALSKNIPEDEKLWPHYVVEIQQLLVKMDLARRINSCPARPYVTAELAGAIAKLTILRYLSDSGRSVVQGANLRGLLQNSNDGRLLNRFLESEEAVNESKSRSVTISSAIRLFELYCDELIAPPRLVTRKSYDDFCVQIEELNWMDDGGEEFLETIRDLPLFTLYDAMPNISSIADWFIATNPALDKNQIKQGWAYLEKSSAKWHQRYRFYEDVEEFVLGYPGWNCAVADRPEEWLSHVQNGHPYKLIPLTTAQELLEESRAMHHCVVGYVDDCVEGLARVFSVRDSISNQRIATAELSSRSGLWELKQLKGMRNIELMQRTRIMSDPLAIIFEMLLNWYNAGPPFTPRIKTIDESHCGIEILQSKREEGA
jgi:hypothetical protein